MYKLINNLKKKNKKKNLSWIIKIDFSKIIKKILLSSIIIS